jgi:membrane protease subunit HflK
MPHAHGHAHGHSDGHSHDHGDDHAHPHTSGRAWWLKLGLLVAAAALAWYVSTGVYFVRTNERAVVRRGGAALKQVRTPDLYFGLPAGIDKVDRLKVLEAKRVGVGRSLSDTTLGRRGAPEQAECLTGDRNLILVSAVVQYHIKDPKAYLFHVADVPALVRNVTAAELTKVISGMAVDDVLTVKRSAIQTRVRQAVQKTLDRYQAGVKVARVLLPGEAVAPPLDVAEAFGDVSSAREDKQRAINMARGYAQRIIPEALGQAYRIQSEAEAYAEKTVQEARGDALRFVKEAKELKEGRAVTFRRLILETLEEILPRVRKIVLDARARHTLDLGLFEDKE